MYLGDLSNGRGFGAELASWTNMRELAICCRAFTPPSVRVAPLGPSKLPLEVRRGLLRVSRRG